MFSNKLYTPLRYPGGKSSFAPFVAKIFEANNLIGYTHVEPYAGGASVALELLFSNLASHIHINDLDYAIFCFWSSITKYPDEILKLLNDTEVNIENWLLYREILRDDDNEDVVKKGFATLFMNRTNRSGILKGGVIGGLNQDGNYKIDARFNKEALRKRIEKIALSADKITVTHLNAIDLINNSKELFPKKTFFYLDPPYYVKGKGLYRNFYTHEDHLLIAKKIQSRNFSFPWLISYDKNIEIIKMYEKSNQITHTLNYTAHKKYKENELLFSSRKIFLEQK